MRISPAIGSRSDLSHNGTLLRSAMATRLAGYRYAILVVTFGLIYSVGYLRTIFRWWYEDDTPHYHYVSLIKNPLTIFLEPQILKGFGAGQALTPLQIGSYWLDVRLFGFSHVAAYAHNIVSLVAVLLLLYFLLEKWTNSRIIAAGGVFIWTLLPSTLVIHQFIAARHYIEGLIFALLMCYSLQSSSRGREKASVVKIIIITLSGLTAMLFKEVFALFVPIFLLVWGISSKRHIFVIIAILLGLIYLCYRLWVFGANIEYGMPLVGISEYIVFLRILPYTFSAGSSGYLIYTGLIILTIALIFQDKMLSIVHILFFAVSAIAILISIYPVTYAVVAKYTEPGTWYRAVAVFNTLLVIWGCFALARLRSTKVQLIVFLVVFLLVLPGTQRTQRLWDARMTRAEAEGMFYLTNPDKLLYSEEDAHWFIGGVNQMYRVPRAHYISKWHRSSDRSRKMLGSFTTIWRYTDGGFVRDDELFREIRNENSSQ